ncbi:colanic acid biosynthesis glycosyltransferase WcaL [Cereibacter changlensis JA139]|uniref:Colanic acid biosynthesis glycosyltransferase WcaL n=2 Tax=Cereibacter changlensis TaxID=402884 RepID=A0A2T4JQH6_9RHOB|nr:glycosyltransferase [Cereibacter changlensis]PTE20170.1 colanic acid biosynthesis glycosyltransferase WcaL [Cereibacter changlensis JA139]PZX50006.1 colanic acid/amylovoran biosynthesis glycosyltransferase [Cereibacter changlensis]
MRLCIVVDTYPRLSETFVQAQAEGLAARGHEVEVLCRESGASGQHGPIRIRRWWGLLAALNGPTERLGFGPRHKVRRALDRMEARYLSGFDVVLAHFGYEGARVAAVLSRLEKAPPLVTIYHGHDVATVIRNGAMSLYDQLFRVGALHLPVNAVFRQMLVDAGAPPERTLVHHMGIASGAFASAPRDWNARPLRILSVGRLTEKKGFAVAIAALERLAEDYPDLDWRYEIVGTGALQEPLRAQAESSAVAGRISFLGARPHAEVQRLLAAAHVFLLPSVTAANGDAEGVPVSLMEAMASGALTVSTDHSGIPELIEDGVTGFLAPERDIPALARRLAAAAHGDCPEGITRAAAEKVRQDFDADHQLLSLELLLSALPENQRTGQAAAWDIRYAP